MNFGMVGEAVNTAHRLVELAQRGEIIVSQSMVKSLGTVLDEWDFEHLPAVAVRDKSIPEEAYRARPQQDESQ
jgi:class 3 adenylate cyclase